MMAKPSKTPPPGYQGADDVSFYLGRAYYNYVGFLQQTLQKFGLHETLRPGMGGVLFALFSDDGCIVKDLSEKLQLAPSTLTSLLRKMEKNGILKSRRCENDGRAVRVHLTKKGRALETRCRELSIVVNERLVRGLSERESLQLKRSLAQVVSNVRDRT